MNCRFPTDQEVKDRKLISRSYDFYMEDSAKYHSIIVDFIGLMIKTLEDNEKESFTVKDLHEMRGRFNHD